MTGRKSGGSLGYSSVRSGCFTTAVGLEFREPADPEKLLDMGIRNRSLGLRTSAGGFFSAIAPASTSNARTISLVGYDGAGNLVSFSGTLNPIRSYHTADFAPIRHPGCPFGPRSFAFCQNHLGAGHPCKRFPKRPARLCSSLISAWGRHQGRPTPHLIEKSRVG
jgi:hypothetical protein